MEENMVKSNDTGLVGNDNQEEERLFTKEQVNEIVRKRLERHKEEIQTLETRTAEVTKRENTLKCREFLMEKDYPKELMDILDTSDVETFMKKAERACHVFGLSEKRVAPLASTEPQDYKAPGFPDTNHTPKGYWATDPR